MDTPEKKAKAIEALRAAMTPISSAYTHAARLDALRFAQGMLYMLWKIEGADSEQVAALESEIQLADRAGVKRCEERLASGEDSRCMEDFRIRDRHAELIALHEGVQAIRYAETHEALEDLAMQFEDRLLRAHPALVDDEELIEWRIKPMEAKKERLQELS